LKTQEWRVGAERGGEERRALNAERPTLKGRNGWGMRILLRLRGYDGQVVDFELEEICSGRPGSDWFSGRRSNGSGVSVTRNGR